MVPVLTAEGYLRVRQILGDTKATPPERVPYLDSLPAYVPLLVEIITALRREISKVKREKRASK
jgi:hypothetical protein